MKLDLVGNLCTIHLQLFSPCFFHIFLPVPYIQVHPQLPLADLRRNFGPHRTKFLYFLSSFGEILAKYWVGATSWRSTLTPSSFLRLTLMGFFFKPLCSTHLQPMTFFFPFLTCNTKTDFVIGSKYRYPGYIFNLIEIFE